MRNTGYRILAQNHTTSNDTWATGRNNNDLIIGPSGAGKTRGYVLPNILQCNESIIVTDTKGVLHGQVGHVLAKHGYDVLEINLADCLASPTGYNPLEYVRYDGKRDKYDEQDIMTVAAAIVPDEPRNDDPYWHRAARMLLESLIGYVLECLPTGEHDLTSVVKLFQHLNDGTVDRLMGELGEIDPDSFAVNRYKMCASCRQAERMWASVIGILAEKISVLSFDGARALLTNKKRIDFRTLGRKKTAVFLEVSDTDRSMDRLAGLFYAQALHVLSDEADHSPGHRLAVPVRMILDDFAAGAKIEDFDGITSVIRSREISVSVILQSVTQLEALYGPARAATILNNCDQLLYLGGQDVGTARLISVKANKSINTILQMPLSDAWLFIRGEMPQQVSKYRLEAHPLYRELPEGRAMTPAAEIQEPTRAEAEAAA